MKIKEFKYSANFCEENIWHLCQNPALEGFSKKVLIVSNSNKYCPFRFQKSINGDEIVWWNYHVILIASNGGSSLIYDFDSTLSVPLPGREYMQKTFPGQETMTAPNLPHFKAIEAEDYLHSFFSDRSHMKDSVGNWLSPPPQWPLIGNNQKLPLAGLLDFSELSKEKIYNLEEMVGLVEALSGSI
jgi:protein N-terminal glutamine amidohydrolase